MGDGFENCILGLIASVLPADNVLSNKLNSTSKSNYFFQKTIKSGHSKFQKMRVYSIPACRKGCCSFIADCALHQECEICSKDNDGELNETVYYFPLIDRLLGIVTSDLKRFLAYASCRQQPLEGYLEDVYDGELWNWFLNQMLPGEFFIGLTFCWDGADMFEFSGKSIWPLSVSILNFPKDLRDKLNIGLHVIAMCTGLNVFSPPPRLSPPHLSSPSASLLPPLASLPPCAFLPPTRTSPPSAWVMACRP